MRNVDRGTAGGRPDNQGRLPADATPSHTTPHHGPRLPHRREHYRRILSRIAASIDLPFGYTLSVWAAGHLVTSRFGFPTPTHVFLFVGGAISGYLLIGGISFPYFSGLGVRRIPGATLLNAASLIAAAAVSLMALFVNSAALGFFLGGFLATAVYALMLSLLVYVGQRIGGRARHRE